MLKYFVYGIILSAKLVAELLDLKPKYGAISMNVVNPEKMLLVTMMKK